MLNPLGLDRRINLRAMVFAYFEHVGDAVSFGIDAQRCAPAESGCGFSPSDGLSERYQFVADAHESEGRAITRLCQALGLRRSKYYVWREGKPARLARKEADAALFEQIVRVWKASGEAYGSPRVTVDLRREGVVLTYLPLADGSFLI